MGREVLRERQELSAIVSELKAIRESLGISLTELSNRTGMTVGNLLAAGAHGGLEPDGRNTSSLRDRHRPSNRNRRCRGHVARCERTNGSLNVYRMLRLSRRDFVPLGSFTPAFTRRNWRSTATARRGCVPCRLERHVRRTGDCHPCVLAQNSKLRGVDVTHAP